MRPIYKTVELVNVDQSIAMEQDVIVDDFMFLDGTFDVKTPFQNDLFSEEDWVTLGSVDLNAGQLVFTNSISGDNTATKNFAVAIGVPFELIIDFEATDTGATFEVRGTSGSPVFGSVTFTGNDTKPLFFTPTQEVVTLHWNNTSVVASESSLVNSFELLELEDGVNITEASNFGPGNDGVAQTISFTSNTTTNAGVTLLIVGEDNLGTTISETLIGPAPSLTVSSSKFYTRVISIQVTVAGATDLRVGWLKEGLMTTISLPISFRQTPGNTTLGMSPSPDPSLASLSLATMEYTLNDPDGDLDSFLNDAGWRSPTELVDNGNGLSASADAHLDAPVRALRGVVGPSTQTGATGETWLFVIIQGNNL